MMRLSITARLTVLTILLSGGVSAAFAAATAGDSAATVSTRNAATGGDIDAAPIAGQAKVVTVRVDTSQMVIAPPPVSTVVQASARSSPAAAGARDAADDAALQALLGATPAEYNKMVKCIATMRVEDTEVLSSRLIVFRDAHHIWINQLAARCPGLTQEAKVAYEGQRANRCCAFDGVHVLNYFGTLATDAIDAMGPGCFLGKFEPISQAQLAVLREHYVPAKPSQIQRINDRESKKKKL